MIPIRHTLMLLGPLLAASIVQVDDPPSSTLRTVRPARSAGPLDNPLKGWCPYADAGPIGLPYAMTFHYASWKELEPEPGRYAFDAWERSSWDLPRARGKPVVIRVYLDYPTKPSGVPNWLVARGVRLTPYPNHGGGLSPDYQHPELLEGLDRLVAAMGRRYDLDPRVAFVQLGLLGHWGEWHTWPDAKLAASPETEARVIRAYRAAFPHKILMARTARGSAGREPSIGYHDDYFPDDTDNGQPWSFLAEIRRAGRGENWRSASIGGEMVPHEARRWLGRDFSLTRSMVERGHFSWVGPYGPAIARDLSVDETANAHALVRRMGYQFRWDEIRYTARIEKGRELSIEAIGENEGVAPFPYPWKVSLTILANDGEKVLSRADLEIDLRTWQPGPIGWKSKTLVEAPAGKHRLAIGIIDPSTGRPGVRFANDLENRGGWVIVGDVEVVEP